MFGLSFAETALILLVAVLVIGPKDLPRVIRAVMKGIGRVKSVAGEFKKGFDEIAKEAELDSIKDNFLTAMPVITDLEGIDRPTFDITAELNADKVKRQKEQAPVPLEPPASLQPAQENNTSEKVLASEAPHARSAE